MTFDATNRKDIRNAEKSSKLAESNRFAYVRTVMSTVGGREWMHSLLSSCHVFHTPYVAGDPHATAFNCGSQNIGLQTFADVVSQCPTEYSLMMQEAQIKDQANDRRNSDDRTPDTSTSFDLDPSGFVHDDSAVYDSDIDAGTPVN